MIRIVTVVAFLLAFTVPISPIVFAQRSESIAQDKPMLEIVWPGAQSLIVLGEDPDRSIGVVVRSNFKLLAAGQCGDDKRCGHVHMKIDPDGDTCNIPGRAYNSMNSDFGGDLIKARFGHCASTADSSNAHLDLTARDGVASHLECCS